MAKQIFDYNKSVPTANSLSVTRDIPRSPSNITLAAFGLYIPDQVSEVELNATLGIRATILNPTVLIKIFRGTTVIFSTRVTTDLSLAEFQTISFTAVDSNPPAGYYAYSLTAEISPAGVLLDDANVVGPITFTGISFG